MKRQYTDEHAEAGLDAELPEIETFPNQFPGYTIEIDMPEFTSVCPKTGQPDYGTITIEYVADRLCVGLKSLKIYLQSYRNEGVFYEDVVSRILDDLVAALAPRRMVVCGEFTPRGGMHSTVTASQPANARHRRRSRRIVARVRVDTPRSPGRA